MSKRIFQIAGVPVSANELQKGDLAVSHPFSNIVRSIVEPICQGRGHWDSDYKNWIVFRQFKDCVLRDLSVAAERWQATQQNQRG